MKAGGDRERGPGREPVLLHHQRGAHEALVDGEVGALGVLDVPLVGDRVAAEDELEAVPLEAVADRAVDAVDRRPGSNRDPVLLVDDLVHLGVVELLHLNLPGPAREGPDPR